MGNFFHKFNTEAAEASAATSGISSPYISYIAESDEVKFGYQKKAVLGDFLHSDGTIDSTASGNVIGVCVIPSNFLPDKKARFVSIKAMDGTETGGTEDKWIYWYADVNSEYDPIYNYEHYVVVNDRAYDRVPIDGNSDGILDIFDNSWGRLPMDRTDSWAVSNITIDNPQDPNTKYHKDVGTNRIPSPYKSDGTLNPNYMYKGSIMGHRNCLQDIYGDRNTETLMKHPHPCTPAKVCRMFSPGFRNGEWYLPAIGELGFLAPRVEFINSKITEAINAGSQGVVLPFSNLWSSSEYGSDGAWGLNLYNGTVYGSDEGSNPYVRAFLATP